MSSPKKRLTVFGSVNMDLVVRVESFPGPGDAVFSSGMARYPGGKGANQAVAAARAGATVRFVGAVGEDEFGRELRRSLREAGVNTQSLRTARGTATGTALITIDRSGENQIVVSTGANGTWTARSVGAIKKAIQHAEMLLVQREIPTSALAAGIREAKRRQVPVVFNAAPAGVFPRRLLRACDVLIVNEQEAEALLGTAVGGVRGGRQAVRELAAELEGGEAIVTLGRDGGWIATQAEKRPIRIPAFRVKAVDTTGAGDTFVGYFSVGRLSGLGSAEAGAFASAAAALSVTRAGAQASIPSHGTVRRFLRRQRRK